MALPDWIMDLRGEIKFDSGLQREVGPNITGIVVHHTASHATTAEWLAWQKNRMEDGYHFGITTNGQVLYFNDISEVVWHCGNAAFNWETVATVFEGYLTGGVEPTPTQFVEFRRLRAWLLSLGIGTLLLPHKAIVATRCPGDWWEAQEDIPKQLLAEPTAPPDSMPTTPPPDTVIARLEALEQWQAYASGSQEGVNARIRALEERVAKLEDHEIGFLNLFTAVVDKFHDMGL